METKIIDFEDGFSVEAEFSEEQLEQVVDLKLPKKFKDGLDESRRVIVETVKHVTSVWEEVGENIKIDGAEIVMGLGFAAEGKVFVVKGSAKANLNIKIKISPK